MPPEPSPAYGRPGRPRAGPYDGGAARSVFSAITKASRSAPPLDAVV